MRPLRFLRKNLTLSILAVLAITTTATVNYWSLAYVWQELTYDNFHDDSESIFRVIRKGSTASVATTAFPLVPMLRTEYPQITSSRIFKDRSKVVFTKEDRTFFETKMVWADSNFLKIFTFDNFVGNPSSALVNPLAIVITGEVRDRYLPGVENPVGESLEFEWNGNTYPLLITGFIEELPNNSHLDFDILISFASGIQLFPGGITSNWTMNYCYSYMKLPAGWSRDQIESQFSSLAAKHISMKEGQSYDQYFSSLQPLTSIHTSNQILGGLTTPVDLKYLWSIGALAVIILLVSAFNYLNLTIIELQNRLKELSVKKTLGASKAALLAGFLQEQFFKVLLGIGLATLLIFVMLPIWNEALGSNLTTGEILSTPYLVFNYLLILVIVAVAAGYAIHNTSRITAVTSSQRSDSRGLALRKGIMVFQLAISVLMIALTILITDQIDYLRNYGLGFNKDHTLIIPQGRQVRDNPDLIKNRFNQISGVTSTALSMYKPGDVVGNKIKVQLPGSNEEFNIAANSIDEHFLPLYNINLPAGTGFAKTHIANKQSYLLINESAVKLLQLENPIGSTLDLEFRTGQPSLPVETRSSKVLGIVADINFEPLHGSVQPMVYLIKPYWYFYISVNISGKSAENTIAALEQEWNELFPGRPFEFFFLEDSINQIYAKEQQLARALNVLVIISVLTALLGLYGLATDIMRRKTKELCIRKVLGAGYLSLSGTLTKELATYFAIALLLAIPTAIYVKNLWLHQFAYKVPAEIGYILYAFLIITTLVVMVLAKQLYRHLAQNPANHLRAE